MTFSKIQNQLMTAAGAIRSRRWLMATLIVAGVGGLYLLVNSWLLPHVVLTKRAAANTRVAGVEVGGQSYDSLETKLKGQLNDTTITLSADDTNHQISVKRGGFTLDEPELRRQLAPSSLLRPYGLPRELELPLQVDADKLIDYIDNLELKQHQPATDASFSVKDGELKITDGKSGRGVDVTAIRKKILAKLSDHLANVKLPLTFTKLEPTVTAQHIKQLRGQILKRTNNNYRLDDGETDSTASDQEKASWWRIDPEDQQLKLTKAKLTGWAETTAVSYERQPTTEVTSKYTSGAKTKITTTGRDGRQLVNLDSTVEKLVASASDVRPAELTLQFKPIPFSKRSQTVDDTPRQRTVTYQVASRGSITSSLEQFASLAAQTMADNRGWKAAGYRFVRVGSGGSFTLTLASAQEVGNASSGCSSAWSCRVGSSVLINDDRWRGATTAWNNAGGNLRDYRHMVVNHEVGHFLGNGHRYCSGSGQLAPVMQQQSIDLQGCRFNPWPLASEIAANR